MIKIEQRDRLLQCVVPAATVRLEESASGDAQRAVPAEMGDLEAAHELLNEAVDLLEYGLALQALKPLMAGRKIVKLAVESRRAESPIGGNEKLCHKPA